MTYQPSVAPWAHQIEALQRSHRAPGFAYLMGMRTGKTKTLLDDFGRLELEKEVDDLLVIAPAGVYETWVTAIEEHVSIDLKARAKIAIWRSGAGKSAMKAIDAFVSDLSAPRIFIVNIEALSTVARLRALAEQFLSARKSMCAVDESTVIKGPDAERTKFVINRLRKLAAYRRILSGLPSPNSPLDIWSQFYFLDPHITGHWTFTTFKARYAKTAKICMLPRATLVDRLRKVAGSSFMVEGIGMISPEDLGRDALLDELKARGVYIQTVETITGYQNEEELRDLIAKHSFRVRLSDCYDVPPKAYLFRDVELTKEQRRIYDELKNFATAELANEAHVTATHVLARMLRLHQVLCGHTVDEEGNEHSIPENRTKELMELLEEWDGKAIIWCSYDADVRKLHAAIEKRYGEGSCARFWGGNKKTREAEEARFKTEPHCRFMVATPAAGGRGRRWDIADLIVYYSNTPNLEHRDQSEERGQAIGKDERVTYVDLRARGTIDEKFIEALRRKINMATIINGDNYREWLI